MPTGKKTRLLIITTALLAFAALAVVLVIFRSRTLSSPVDEFESSRTPVGGLFDRISRVSRLKEQMGELRGVWPAMNSFAEAHQGILPTNLVALRPYLPTNLAALSDERWEMPSGGLEARDVMQRNDAILLQRKNVPPGSARLIVYGDGHIEYKQ